MEKPFLWRNWSPLRRPDFYELLVTRTDLASGLMTHELVRFIVSASERGNSEWGLPVWTPHPWIPSTAGEFAGSQLRLLMPSAFPRECEIPVVAWVKNDQGLTVRANGVLEASGHPAIAVRRGVGSGFLAANHPAGPLVYEAKLPGIQVARTVAIQENTAWKSVAGLLEGAVSWGENQRIQVTADLTIPLGSELTIGAGTVVRLGPGVSIILDGRLTIHGTTDAPVVFAPAERAKPWGGVRLRLDSSEVIATGTIFTGSGANPNWFADHGYSSHRGEECLFFCDRSPRVSLTDCAAIDLAGQLGHALNGGKFELTRCLVQRCSTGGEYTGSTWTVNDSAFIECPVDSAEFVDGDNDGLYLVSGAHTFTNTLFGWVKDDAIDCGGSGVGTLTLQSCWFESVFHEALALSGAKNVTARDSVFIDCGQGLEVGYSGPLALADHCLAVGNLTGMRFGDNYNWSYTGFLTVTNSILLHNHRDVFGYTWNTSGSSFDTNQWVERVLQMDVRDNYLTSTNRYHAENTIWDDATDGWRLASFLTTAPGAQPGVGIGLRAAQLPLSAAADGIPLRLSDFATNRAAVNVVVECPGQSQSVQRLEFYPGETCKSVPVSLASNPNPSVVRVKLSDPEACELTGMASVLLFDGAGLGSKLGWARFDSDLVLYWNDSGSTLEHSNRVEGPWEPITMQASPATIPIGQAQHFYRLRTQ